MREAILGTGNMGGKVPIKILCGCGQKYAFDVEPADGGMPWVVTCPACGADGTAAANAAIAHATPSTDLAQEPASSATAAPVALLPARAASQDSSARALLEQLKSEVSRSRAGTAVTSLEKAKPSTSARRSASVKMMVGTGLLFVPLAAYLAFFLFMKNSAVPSKLFAGAVAIGLAGAGLVIAAFAEARFRKM